MTPIENIPTARWDPETRTAVPIDPGGGAAEPAPAYTDGKATVKGILVTVLIPHALAARAEAAGVPLTTNAQVGACRRIREAVDRRGADDSPPPVRSPRAADARALLGLEMAARRKELKLSRRVYHSALATVIDHTPGEMRQRGWGLSSVSAWERGIAAPRQIEPIIKVLKPGPSAEVRWRQWWGTCRVGVPDAVRQEALSAKELAAGVGVAGELSAVDRLKLTLAENS